MSYRDLFWLRRIEGSLTINVDIDSEIFVASHVLLYGTSYIPGMYVTAYINDDGEPQFGRIDHILVSGAKSDEVYFASRMCHTTGFSTHFHSYMVKYFQEPRYCIKQLESLVDHLPLLHLQSYEQDSPIYLCPRYSLKQRR